MDISIFKEVGLTDSEIAVYLKLLELKSTHAGAVIEKTGLQTSVVHRTLNSLIEKGLINFIIEGKIRTYQATQPENFLDFIDDKKKRFEKLIPELKKIEAFTGKEETAVVYKGIRGIKEAYNVMINIKGKEYLTFGGGPPCVEVMGVAWWLNLHERRISQGLVSRQVFDESVMNIGGHEIAAKKMTNIRYMSKDFAQFQETVIVGDCVSINVFTKNPYSMIIKDKSVAEGYRKYFEFLWLQGKIMK
ncbi:MAG: TrmB family transcriptional regulator [Candidatus Nanoarchaeia archaeon]